jgi:hypothetical protein
MSATSDTQASQGEQQGQSRVAEDPELSHLRLSAFDEIANSTLSVSIGGNDYAS